MVASKAGFPLEGDRLSSSLPFHPPSATLLLVSGWAVFPMRPARLAGMCLRSWSDGSPFDAFSHRMNRKITTEKHNYNFSLQHCCRVLLTLKGMFIVISGVIGCLVPRIRTRRSYILMLPWHLVGFWPHGQGPNGPLLNRVLPSPWPLPLGFCCVGNCFRTCQLYTYHRCLIGHI